MTPNPILKVLSTLTSRQVRYLLMGGQACVFYGAAEFSRDTDIAILAEPANLANLEKLLADLQAEVIAVPPFELDYLLRGHAIHFRCQHPECPRMRLDVMAKMRGVPPFEELWARRRTLQIPSGDTIDLMDLSDLVQAKKTQRDKDWPMISRLVEAHFQTHQAQPTPEQIGFWLQEARSVSLLVKLANLYPEALRGTIHARPLLALAASGDESGLEQALLDEERREREADRQYWLPLKKELERLRHSSP